jgi:hypothetical protein
MSNYERMVCVFWLIVDARVGFGFKPLNIHSIALAATNMSGLGYAQRLLLIILATISIGFMMYSYQRSSLATSSYHAAVRDQFTDYIQPASSQRIYHYHYHYIIPCHSWSYPNAWCLVSGDIIDSAADVRAEAKRISDAFAKFSRV